MDEHKSIIEVGRKMRVGRRRVVLQQRKGAESAADIETSENSELEHSRIRIGCQRTAHGKQIVRDAGMPACRNNK